MRGNAPQIPKYLQARVMGWNIVYFEEREGMCVALMLSASDGLIL
jgi:hypothetical protein